MDIKPKVEEVGEGWCPKCCGNRMFQRTPKSGYPSCVECGTRLHTLLPVKQTETKP